MNINASDVKKIREETGAGMMDCKKALVEAKGDFNKAKLILREKGLAQAQKKQSRIAAEGLCAFRESKNVGYLYEINIETDFAAQNKNFHALIDEVGEILLKSKAKDTNAALKLKNKKGETIESLIQNMTAKIGEKITLRNVQRIEKKAKEFFFDYTHQGGKMIGLLVLDKKEPEVGRNLGMQVVAMKPDYLSEKDVPKKIIDAEKKILTTQIKKEGKPEKIIPKIVEGKIRKYYEEHCLLNQLYVRDDKITVDKYLKQNKVNVISYYRIEVGLGIEKREEDFAAEVKAQMK